MVLLFPPPVDHILSEFSTMTCPSWVALHSMAHSFSELCKPLCHDKSVINEGEMNALETIKKKYIYIYYKHVLELILEKHNKIEKS